MEAQISLQGNVGTVVEFSSGADWCLARFRMACTPSWRKGTGWVSGETLWVTVLASGQMAMNVRDSVHKGDPLVVFGRLRNHVWQDAEGQRREAEQIEAISLGHDLARGVSTFIRPNRAPSRHEDGPLVPDGMRVDQLDATPADPEDLEDLEDLDDLAELEDDEDDGEIGDTTPV
ncbi:MAG: single-stranded DNA-binding protein [Propionibacteriaceae bacterium]|nr:single-stranded DNA-binding protein [Propionibacteriaceae bacterium]